VGATNPAVSACAWPGCSGSTGWSSTRTGSKAVALERPLASSSGTTLGAARRPRETGPGALGGRLRRP
jgi:hypothetical protein